MVSEESVTPEMIMAGLEAPPLEVLIIDESTFDKSEMVAEVYRAMHAVACCGGATDEG